MALSIYISKYLYIPYNTYIAQSHIILIIAISNIVPYNSITIVWILIIILSMLY